VRLCLPDPSLPLALVYQPPLPGFIGQDEPTVTLLLAAWLLDVLGMADWRPLTTQWGANWDVLTQATPPSAP
jgi:hypothetical protein